MRTEFPGILSISCQLRGVRRWVYVEFFGGLEEVGEVDEGNRADDHLEKFIWNRRNPSFDIRILGIVLDFTLWHNFLHKALVYTH